MSEKETVVNRNTDEIDEIIQNAVDDSHDNALQEEAEQKPKKGRKKGKVANLNEKHRAQALQQSTGGQIVGEQESTRISVLRARLRMWLAETALGGNEVMNRIFQEQTLGDGLAPWIPLIAHVPAKRGASVQMFKVVCPERKILEEIDEDTLHAQFRNQSIRACHSDYGLPDGKKMGVLGHMNAYEVGETMRTMMSIARDPEYHGITPPIRDEIPSFAFADDPGWAFARLPFERPQAHTAVEPGNMDYSALGPYFRDVLNRMMDYQADTDQSRMFESLLECLAMTFLQTAGSKVVPFVYGPPGAAKTAFVEDIGSLMDSAFLGQQNLLRITEPYFMATLQGKRLVHIDEVPKGDQLSEDFKALTGGSEYITGRSPHAKPVTFRNTCMFWITSNHPPLFGKDDAAIVRFRVIGINKLVGGFEALEDQSTRRKILCSEIADVLRLGASLLALNGGIARESASDEIAERISDELEIIAHQVSKYFAPLKGAMLPVAEVKLWAQAKRHNFKRVESALLNLADGQPFAIEKVKSSEGTRKWCYKNLSASRFIEVLAQNTY